LEEFGSIPKAVYYYSILNKIVPYSFSETQLQAYEKRLEYLVESILQKGFNVELYEPRKWDHMFNGHKKACLECIKKREQNREQIRISTTIKNNTLFFDNSLPDDIKSILMKKYKYKVAGCEFSELFQKRLWDGNKRFFSHNSIPLGFIHDFENLIADYNEYFNKSVILDYIDLRDDDVKDMIYDTKFKDSDYILYDFQEDCVNKAIENEIGIVFVGTGGGKTLISSE
jgi:hypothetical protein